MADYALPLLAIPYLIRTVGVWDYGKIAFIQAFALYFVMLTEYGFNFSGTRMAAVERDNQESLSVIFWSIQSVKLIIAFISAILAIFLFILVGRINELGSLWFLILLPIIGNVVYPLWVIQGLELMKSAAIIMLMVRLCLLGLIILNVHSSDDIFLATALLLGATPIAGILSWIVLYLSNKIKLVKSSWQDVVFQFKSGWHVFWAGLTSNVYRSTNVVVLGLISNPEAVTFYSLSEKLVKAAQELSRPFVQATYPRVSQHALDDSHQALILLRRLLLFIVLMTFFVFIVFTVFAPEILMLMTDQATGRSITLLRVMAILPLIGGINSVLGVQSLLPFQFHKSFSMMVTRTGVFSLVIMMPLIYKWSDIGAAANYLLSELFLLVQLLVFHKKNGLSILKLKSLKVADR